MAWVGYCEYGCRESHNPETRVKVNGWNNSKCSKCGGMHPRREHDAEYAAGFCGHQVRNQGDETDSLCNAKAVGIYSEWKRIPGLFRKWEFAQIVEDSDAISFQKQGKAEDGTQLWALYRHCPEATL